MTHFAKPLFSSAQTAWVISDGTKGMEVQSIGLAERMGLKTTIIRLSPPSLLRSFPRLGKSALLGTLFGASLRCPKEIRPHTKNGWPDLIITTGKRMAGLSILLRRLSKGQSQTIHIQDPKLPSHLFDVMIVPSHDKLPHNKQRGDNVLITTGSLNALTPKKIKDAAKNVPELVTILPKPLIVFMIGGSNRRYSVGEAELYRLGEYASALAHATDSSVAFVPSRRSHELAAQCIRKMMGRGLITTPSYWIWDPEDDENPYPGIMDHAAAIVVTSDSVNMTSEACLSGKPVYRYDFREEHGRIGLFHRIMDKGDYTRPLEPITPSTFPGSAGQFLDETGRIAEILTGRKAKD